MAVKNNVFILGNDQQVIFPMIRTRMTVDAKTFQQICDSLENDGTEVGVIAAKSPKGSKNPELFNVGTYCKIVSNTQSSTKNGDKEVSVYTLMIEGQSRFEVEQYTQKSPHRLATIRMLAESKGEAESAEVKALQQKVQQLVGELLKETSQGLMRNLFGGSRQKNPRWPQSPAVLADMIAAGLKQLTIGDRQQVLETVPLVERLTLVLELVSKAAEVQRLSQAINQRMTKRTEEELRETVLRRQLQELGKLKQDLQKEMRSLKAGSKPEEGEGSEGGGGDPDAEGAEDEEGDDISILRESLKKAQLSPEAEQISRRELRRLQNIQPQHPEYNVCRTYLETLASLPWNKQSKDTLDLEASRHILEGDHYGLEKVKRRILEFLAVQKMRGDMKGPILCLHGPPGVGKTSLGRSIAKALGRKFHRLALGGVRDEAELRGHRRTYIGSMPGSIIQALITMKVKNPVILLDEVDKLTRNAMFNPQGALLELLDSEQNDKFKDHYVNTPFDCSQVLFLCTCNELQTIDRPLLDRMEVIELAGYTVEEKLHIATTHLLPKQRKLHALEREDPEPDKAEEASGDGEDRDGAVVDKEKVEKSAGEQAPQLPEEPILSLTKMAISDLITKWTMESGVRSLERRLAQVCRWAALRHALGDGRSSALRGEQPSTENVEADRVAEAALMECGPDANGCLTIDAHHLPYIVGAELFEPDLAERLTVGVAMGLSVTATGGQLLFIEATRSKGTGRLTVTGQLGEVMKESVSTAMSQLRSKFYHAALDRGGEESVPKLQGVWQQLFDQADGTKDPFGNDDVHVHFPAGAIPKDGPSAGVATTLALASLLLGRPVRSDTAVTGEITLRGHVLPVGGVRDKVLAAHRAGVRHVLLPFANQRHVKDEIPPSAIDAVELHYVKHIDEALRWAFGEGRAKSRSPSLEGLQPPPASEPPGTAPPAITLARL